LVSASERDSVVRADRVWSLDGGKLTPTLGHTRTDAPVIKLRRGPSESRRAG